MTVYKILKGYHDTEINYYVMPYDLKGSLMCGMPKRKWWYRSEKKAIKICNKKQKNRYSKV